MDMNDLKMNMELDTTPFQEKLHNAKRLLENGIDKVSLEYEIDVEDIDLLNIKVTIY